MYCFIFLFSVLKVSVPWESSQKFLIGSLRASASFMVCRIFTFHFPLNFGLNFVLFIVSELDRGRLFRHRPWMWQIPRRWSAANDSTTGHTQTLSCWTSGPVQFLEGRREYCSLETCETEAVVVEQTPRWKGKGRRHLSISSQKRTVRSARRLRRRIPFFFTFTIIDTMPLFVRTVSFGCRWREPLRERRNIGRRFLLWCITHR